MAAKKVVRKCQWCEYRTDSKGRCRRYAELEELCLGETPWLPVITVQVPAGHASFDDQGVVRPRCGAFCSTAAAAILAAAQMSAELGVGCVVVEFPEYDTFGVCPRFAARTPEMIRRTVHKVRVNDALVLMLAECPVDTDYHSDVMDVLVGADG